jgi:hypothetical protein
MGQMGRMRAMGGALGAGVAQNIGFDLAIRWHTKADFTSGNEADWKSEPGA